MLTGKDYCDYETCVALKELGIGWENVPEKWAKRYFFTRITLYDALKWLREEKNIDISVTISFEYFVTIREFIFWRGEYSWKTPPIYPNGAKTYEEALLEGIKGAVKILKAKQDE